MNDSLSWAVRLQVEQVCTRFERAWQAAGPPPRIEDYLAEAAAPVRQTLLRELLLLDLHYRRRRGEQPDTLDYTARFPAESDLVREALAAPGPSVPRPAAAESTDAPSRAGPAQAGSTDPEGGGAAGAAAAGPSNPTIPGYEFRGELGRGGMGTVIRCRDLHLDRDLAVKVLLDRYRGEPHLVQRFLAEARIHGRLQHPGVVPVHELGELPDRRPYFTMKLVEGRTLADLLRERADTTQNLPRFLTIFEQVCQTLAYAHSKGVIHRDLKPSNVMVGAFSEVQVMDWGLAKVLDRGGTAAGDCSPAGNGDLERVTQPGTVLGTYAYMAPEQARGEVDRLDEHSDVFGLGAILCEVLTGEPPFAGADSEELRARAQRCDHAAALEAVEASGADAELVRLAKGCLAADPAVRPRDAGAVAAAMAAYLAGVQERLRQSELERAAAQGRAAEERRRRQAQLWLAAAVLALLAVGAGAGLFVQHQDAERSAERQANQARREAEQRQRVESALEKAAVMREQARWREAQAVLEQARLALGDAGPDDLRRRLDVADGELALVNRLDAIRQRMAAWVEGHLDSRGAARDYAAAFREAGLAEVGDDEEAVAARVRASGVAGPLVAALDDWAFMARQLESRSWLLRVARRAAPDAWGNRFRDPAVWRDRQALRALAEEALRDERAKLGELSPQLLVSLGGLLGDSAETVPLLRAAQRHYPNDFWLSLELANALAKAKRYEEAVGYGRVAVALRPDAAAAHASLGNALAAKKDLEGAIAAYRKAIELDPKFAPAHCNLGLVLCDKKDLEGAIAEYRQAIELDAKEAMAHYNLGLALYDKGDLEGAIAAYRQAIELVPEFSLAHNNLGNALYDKGDQDGAILEYHKAIELDPKNAPAHSNLATALFSKKDMDGAVAECRKAIELDAKLAPPHITLGLVLGAKKDLDGAIAACRTAIDLDPKCAKAHLALGLALFRQGRFVEARTATRRGLELIPERDPGRARQGALQLLQWCERLVTLDEKLSAVLGGQAEPADAAELLALGQLCQRYKRQHAAAARLYAGAFAAGPKLAADLRQQDRYNAACSAALAAAGQGGDAKHLPDKVQEMLRRQALGWLRDDLALYAKLAQRDEPAAKQAVRQTLTHWQQDTDLASVRDRAALDELPDDEGQQWHALWRDVAALLAKAGATPP
jgi:serine/threonine-protein kinase